MQQDTVATARLKLYTRVQVHARACMFNACKTTKKLACARTVPRDFGARTRESKHDT